MTIREQWEQHEALWLSPHAVRSADTRGREHPVTPCEVRTDFQRDRDRIIHSKGFRRLKFKTQVFLAPKGDHYRTRLTHTLEVSQVARTLARALHLNEDLTEAIALGHDLGTRLSGTSARRH
jgi:dGTPase